MSRQKPDVVTILMSALTVFIVVGSTFSIGLLTLIVHCVLTDHRIQGSSYWIILCLSFVVLVRYLFPFFVFQKDKRTDEERAKFYRIM